jgi:hypothetical protein
MNSELDEEYGAGFEGTKALLYKYIKDTPGQSIQQYMKTKSLSEILKKSDPVGDWIRDFIDSDNSRFVGKSKKERINMALGAYYAAQRNESTAEVELEESTVSASQINRYIDTENWKAIADLMKGLNDDEHELWAKNGYDGRTYELLMKTRKKTRKESVELDEMRELYAVVDTTDGTVVATASSEDGAKRSIRSAHLPPISSEHPSKLKIVKTKKTAQVGYPIKEETNKLTEKIDVEALLDAAVALRKKNPQLRKGQSIMIALHDVDKKAYDNARNKADAFNNDSKIPQLIQLLDPSYYKEEKNLEESPSLDTLRIMKIVSLATGSKDMDALYEYACTSPSYSSIIELKEAFNKYIQQA